METLLKLAEIGEQSFHETPAYLRRAMTGPNISDFTNSESSELPATIVGII